TYCMNNNRQMGIAWLMYINDNNDSLPDNCDKNSAVPNSQKTQNWICPAVGNMLPVLDWGANGSDFNTTNLIYDQEFMGEHSVAQLGPYVAKQIKIFVCPSDHYLSPAQNSPIGRMFQTQYGISTRIRSCAMDGAMGGGSKYYQGVWGSYYDVLKMSYMHWPGPADCWVVTDEHPDANDDCALYVNPADVSPTQAGYDGKITELPGSMHGKGAGIFFADGHSEIHVWKGGVDTIPVRFASGYSDAQGVSVSGDPGAQYDLSWWAAHTPAH
ncbi:MAG: DUF1559 domain-containing protein, partial [Limisphaerales bacterium]